jgi:hypothetical protein
LVNLTEEVLRYFYYTKSFWMRKWTFKRHGLPQICYSLPVSSLQKWTMLQNEQSQYFNTPKANWGGRESWIMMKACTIMTFPMTIIGGFSPRTLCRAVDIFRNEPVTHYAHNLAVTRG